MNIFNRLVVILLILIAMIVIPLALMFPEQAQIALRYGADIIQANLEWLNSLDETAQIGVRLLLAAVGMVVFFVGLVFLVLEVIRIRRSTVKLKDGSGQLMMDGVSKHLEYHIDLLPGVIRVKPKVRSRGKNVRASVYVETAAGVNVLDKSNEVREIAREVLEEQLGLHVDGDVNVVIKPVAYPKGAPPKKKAEEAAPAEPAIEEEAPPKKPAIEERPLVTLPPVEPAPAVAPRVLPPVEPTPEMPPRVVPPVVEPPRAELEPHEREPEPGAFPPPLGFVESEEPEGEIIEVKRPPEPSEGEPREDDPSA